MKKIKRKKRNKRKLARNLELNPFRPKVRGKCYVGKDSCCARKGITGINIFILIASRGGERKMMQ